jgi:hypothetical protein
MALEREPDHRFQTAAEMADAIESAAKVAAQPDEESVATERTVETLMKGRYGGDADAQREELRTFLQATPTMVGPRKNPAPTDPGWIGPTASEPGLSEESVTVAANPPDEPTRASSNPPGTVRSWPVPSPPPVPRAESSAPPPAAAEATEDDTHIYDPTSTTGVTADPEPSEIPPAEPLLHQSAGMPLVRERRTPWPIIAVLLVGALGVAAFVVYRSGTVIGTDDVTVNDEAPEKESRKPAAPPPEPTPEQTASAAPSDEASGEASATPAPVPRRPWPHRPVTRPAPKPEAKPEPKPEATPEPKPEPKPNPKPGPGDLEDLSNPYR